MSHLSSCKRRTRTAILTTLALTALGATAAGPAQAVPIGACDGPCTPAAQKTVSVYRATFSYSTPYFNARGKRAIKPGSYVATCETFSSAAGSYGNRWWSHLRDGYWVNNGELRGGERMGLPPCTTPPNDGGGAGAASPGLHPALKSCRNSDWMTRAGGIGSGSGFVVEMQPTFRARVFGRSGSLRGKPYVAYIWRDLQRCVRFPANLTGSQRESLYKQLVCHVQYGVARPVGGNTWDLEARLRNVSWARALTTCNW